MHNTTILYPSTQPWNQSKIGHQLIHYRSVPQSSINRPFLSHPGPVIFLGC